MIHSFPLLPCPKCGNTNDANVPLCQGCPQKSGDYSICLKCGSVSKLNEFGLLEETSEFELGMLEDDTKELVSKVQEGIKNGCLSIDLSLKNIAQIGEAFGRTLSNRMSDLRNRIANDGIIPPQALDNVLVQAMVYELASSIISMLKVSDSLIDERGSSLLNKLRGGFNHVVRKFAELHGKDVKIVSIDLGDLEKEEEEDGKEHGPHRA